MSIPHWRPILRGLTFPEGPAVRGETLACMDVEDGAVHVLDGGHAWHIEVGGRPNGAAFDAAGDLIVADSGRKAILRVKLLEGTVEALWDYGLRGPNDLLVEGESVTFTDPGDSNPENRIGRVLRLILAGPEMPKVLADGLAFPNGLARRPDGSLLVAETRTGRLLLKDRSFEPVSEGLRDRDGNRGPDGLALLPGGSLAAAVYGAGYVAVLGHDFSLRKRLPVPGNRPTNVCHDGESLYCTEVDTGALWVCPLGDVLETRS